MKTSCPKKRPFGPKNSRKMSGIIHAGRFQSMGNPGKGKRATKRHQKAEKGEKSYLVSPFLPKVRCKKEEEMEKQLKNKQQKDNKRGGKGKGHKTEERRKMMKKI